jgi:hypothetical protein
MRKPYGVKAGKAALLVGLLVVALWSCGREEAESAGDAVDEVAPAMKDDGAASGAVEEEEGGEGEGMSMEGEEYLEEAAGEAMDEHGEELIEPWEDTAGYDDEDGEDPDSFR